MFEKEKTQGKKSNELLKNDVCKKAVVLIDENLFVEHPNVEYKSIKFLPMKGDFDIEPLKALIA